MQISGARTHNLKNISLGLPQGRLIVITGPSGSGKSSLAFDTIYAEGQRRFLEGVTGFARQFLTLLPRPDVDSIDGLSPTIAVRQLTRGGSPLSSVATSTGIAELLRLLFARAGTPCCPIHGIELKATPISSMASSILEWPQETPVLVLSPVTFGTGFDFSEFFRRMASLGFQRFRVGSAIMLLDEINPESLTASPPGRLDIVVDRLKLRPGSRDRLSESLELAASLSGGKVGVMHYRTGEELRFSTNYSCPECDFSFSRLEPSLFSSLSPQAAPAESDAGDREAALHVFLGSPKGPNYPALLSRTLSDFGAFFETLKFEDARAAIADPVLQEIKARAGFLIQAGLGYLSLSRTLDTLSGGETQRIRLAAQLSTRLSGVTYVLDEPSAGLHPAENDRLINTLLSLRGQGNTVIVVEHREETMKAADYLVDMGPGAGEHGGMVCAAGTLKEVMASPASLTGAFLSGRKKMPLPVKPRVPGKTWITIREARANNLKGISVRIPEGCVTAVTGLSGSGKSSLVNNVLYKAASRMLNHADGADPVACTGIEGLENFSRVLMVDQSPIGRTPRSIPASYLGLFQLIREVFAEMPLAKERGYTAGRFSFNIPGGRCETCQGEGIRQIKMQLLPDVFVPCDTCHGTRYNSETLEVRYKGLNIAEVLDLTVEQAMEHFKARPAIMRKLRALAEVGLSYIHLGQPSHTLSGGECQRIKIAAELARPDVGRTLYIFDEPTAGLHMSDIAVLSNIFQKLCDAGNTVVLTEHEPQIIASCDWVIDLGGRGPEGGWLAGEGTPSYIKSLPQSLTGKYL
ncbi:hypothetical protein MUN46_003430 [Mesosutterella sp. AGMB02718]|uniref:UvrABC system protein A n=1 Tax=Mesosutterella faecium TaxID=2925194 RepID=A0ABT7IKW0_9BURK|nr:hypothetical protein [Mesosutterella sp. AGMB02718]MDL2059000.1 hypothetical protein [Mesosutterella sp. AGMB02718]